MKHLSMRIVALLALLSCAPTANGDEIDAGTIRTAESGGYTWSYRLTADGGAEITKGDGVRRMAVTPTPSGELAIPSALDGLPVRKIGPYALYLASGLRTVKIPDSVEEIGDCAFHKCWSLRTVALPSGLRRIGASAFASTKLSGTVLFPASVEYVDRSAFDGTSVAEFSVSADNAVYSSWDGILYSSDGTRLVRCPPGKMTYVYYDDEEDVYVDGSPLVIPDGVLEICDHAFSGCVEIGEVILPDGLVTIGSWAMQGCVSVSVPASVANVGEAAFAGCSRIDVQAGGALKSVGGIVYDADMTTLIFCLSGKSGAVIVPEGVEKIGPYAFYRASGLVSVDLPSTMKSIGAHAFEGCGIQTVVLPDGLEYLGEQAFGSCENMVSIAIPAMVDLSDASSCFSACFNLKDVYIIGAGSGISGLQRFYDVCPHDLVTHVTSAWEGPTDEWQGRAVDTVPDGYVVPPLLFADCFYYANEDPDWNIFGDYVYYDSYEFTGRRTVAARMLNVQPGVELRYTLDGSDPAAESAAYSGQPPKITLLEGETVTVKAVAVRDGAVSPVVSLVLKRFVEEEPDVPSERRSPAAEWKTFDDGTYRWSYYIDEETFGGVVISGYEGEIKTWDEDGDYWDESYVECRGVWPTPSGRVEIPATIDGRPVVALGHGLFSGSDLTEAVLPDTVRTIGDGAFSGCYNLRRIVFCGNAPEEIGEDAFPDVLPDCTVVVPSGSTGWGVDIPGEWRGMRIEYAVSFTVEDGVLVSVSAAGETCVAIPGGVTNVAANAFSGCPQLERVTIPDGVETISPAAFDGCGKLWAKWFRTLERLSADPESEVSADAVALTVTNVVVHYVTASVPSEAVTVPTDTGLVSVVGEVSAGSAIAVSSGWAAQYPGFEERFGSDFAAALTKTTGKRDGAGNAMMVWQDFVAGTDPTDPDDVFTASIAFDADGRPVVSWSPELPAAEAAKRRYVTYGKAKLNDADWTMVADGEEDRYNFFKVTVEMK